MKVLFSRLKNYLPDLDVDVNKVCEVFTEIGFMVDGPVLEIVYNGKNDYLIDLEVRQNRGDLNGVLNLAKELGAYFNIKCKTIERITLDLYSKLIDYSLPIEISAVDSVKRVMSIKLTNIKISESPQWLKEYLTLYGINPINNLVDFTNLVMLETGHASHAFDVNLMGSDKLIWEDNKGKYKEFVTLAGEDIKLNNDTVIISNGKSPLSLLMIGGKDVAINDKTTDIIIEMAVYDPGVVRRNSQSLKIKTEAGGRLDKHLDPETIPQAFYWIVNLIVLNCKGVIASKIYDNYLHIPERNNIKVRLDKTNQIAGIDIPREKQLNYLERLGFEIVENTGDTLTVERPLDRLDIECEEDVFEEIIRLNGFYSIPKNNIKTTITSNVTPTHLRLIDEVSSSLISYGFDEVRSNVLIGEGLNSKFLLDKKEVRTINSVNEEFPILRQSIIVSLVDQLNERAKQYDSSIGIFEFGKVFYKDDGSYSENYSLGLLINSNSLSELQLHVDRLLRSIGFEYISFESYGKVPDAYHPLHYYLVKVNDKVVGNLSLLRKDLFGDVSVADLNIDLIDTLNKYKNNSTKEVLSKLVILDSNLTLKENENIDSLINKIIKKDKDFIWSWEVIDKFINDETLKYTVRITYLNLSDTEAKELHRSLFE